MSNLTRWDPFDEMMSFRKAMDRFFERPLAPSMFTRGDILGLDIDLSESDDAYIVEASIPGINPDDLDITYSDRVLTIKGETKEDHEKEEKGKYHIRERRYGSFCRSISLPAAVKDKDIKANYQDGILKLELPKSEEAKPKKITVKSGGKKVIDV